MAGRPSSSSGAMTSTFVFGGKPPVLRLRYVSRSTTSTSGPVPAWYLSSPGWSITASMPPASSSMPATASEQRNPDIETMTWTIGSSFAFGAWTLAGLHEGRGRALLTANGYLAELHEGLLLYLPDALPRHPELPSYGLEGPGRVVAYPEAQAYYLPLVLVQHLKPALYPFAPPRLGYVISGRGRALVLYALEEGRVGILVGGCLKGDGAFGEVLELLDVAA